MSDTEKIIAFVRQSIEPIKLVKGAEKTIALLDSKMEILQRVFKNVPSYAQESVIDAIIGLNEGVNTDEP